MLKSQKSPEISACRVEECPPERKCFHSFPSFQVIEAFPVFPELSIKMVVALGIGVALNFFSHADVKSGEVLKKFIRR